MPQYLLLLHEPPPDPSALSPGDIEAIIAEYMAWRQGLVDRGIPVGGEKLSDDGGRHLRMREGRLQVVDGPYAEAKEILGGYFMVTAADYAAAVALASECPHLRHGGWIEVRQVEDLGA